MKCVSLTVVLLFCVKKLTLASNLDDLQSRFPMRYASPLSSLKCGLDETLIVGRFTNATAPMYFIVCGHNNPCGSSLNCVLTRSDSCAGPGEYTSSLSKEIFGITSICCKYDLTATNLDEHCEVTTIQANSTITITRDAIRDQTPYQPTQPTPNVNDKDGPTKGKAGQGNAAPKPKPSSGNSEKPTKVPVKMYIADVDRTLVAVKDRAVKSILEQSNGEWQITMCTLTCRKSTTRQPDSNSEDDSNNVADEIDDDKTDESQNVDSSQEHDRSSQSDSSQIEKDPCDVNGEELQALLPNKIHGFNGGLCTNDVKPCKINCRNLYGTEYLAAVCRTIRGSGCQKKICLCVKNSNSEDDNNNVADEIDDGKTDGSQNFDSSQENDRSSQSDSSQIEKDPCDMNDKELQALLPNKIHGFNYGGVCTNDVQPCKINCRNIYGTEYRAAVCRGIRGSGCRKKICLCVTKKHNENQKSENADIADTSIERDGHSKSRTKPQSEVSKSKSNQDSGSKSMSESKSDSSKTNSKSKSDSLKAMSKSKSDTLKTKSKSKKDSSKTMSNSKSDSLETKSKSKSDSSKTMSNSQSDSSKTKSESKSDSSNSKSKSKSDGSNSKSKSKSDSSKSQNSVESKSQSQSVESETDSKEQQAIAKPKPSATCFSRDTIVTTRNGPVRMDKLSKGTEVLVRREMGLIAVFQPIQWFIHRDLSRVTNFIDISDDKGHNVTLSPNHLIPIGDCLDTTYQHDEIMFRRSIFAKHAKIDMCMFISDNNSVIKQTKIIQIRNSVKTGIYSPITASGSLIVNEGVIVSCYSQFQNQLLQQTMFNILNNFFDLFDSSSMSDTTIDVPLLIRYMNYFAALVSL